jgi:hypothetical protein
LIGGIMFRNISTWRRLLVVPVVIGGTSGILYSTFNKFIFKGEEAFRFNFEFPKEWKINKTQLNKEQMIQIKIQDEDSREHLVAIICEEKENDFDFENYLKNSKKKKKRIKIRLQEI